MLWIASFSRPIRIQGFQGEGNYESVGETFEMCKYFKVWDTAGFLNPHCLPDSIWNGKDDKNVPAFRKKQQAEQKYIIRDMTEYIQIITTDLSRAFAH